MDLLIIFMSAFLWSILWLDPMKIAISLETLGLIVLLVTIMLLILDALSISFITLLLVRLVCEASLSFIISIIHISFNFDLVNKLMIPSF